MTSAELVERALKELPPLSPDDALALRTKLAVRIPQALRQLAERSINTGLLRKTFSVTATNGEAPLATPLTTTEPLILEGLKRASIYITGFTYAAQWKADRASLSFPASTQFPYWTLENQTIVIRDGTGLDSYDGPVTIRNAPYVPVLASVPVSLEPLLVHLLAHGEPSTQVAATVPGADRGRS